MDTTIKKRIEEINSGRVPEGYKMTLVGIAPEEWKENVLADFFEFKNGLNKEKSAFGQGTPIINYTDVWGKRGLYSKDIKGKVSLSKKEIENYGVKKGDVFFTRTSETKQEIGLSSVLLEDVENCVFSGFVLRARPKNMEIIDVYNQYCYSSELMRYEIIKNSSITTRALTNGTLLGKVHINLPTIKEQSRIAEILMQWDKAIDLQEKLIKSYQNLKKYYLSKMFPKKGSLYPEIRFAGFTEPWNKCRFSDIFDYERPDEYIVSNEEYDDSYNTPVLTANKSFILGYSHETKTYNKPCIIFDDFTLDCKYVDFSFMVKSSSLKILTAKSDNNLRFCYERLANSNIDNLGHVRHYINVVQNVETTVPTSCEQEKIALFFEQIDNFILYNTKKLDKIIKQRKALQQYLLTGIVRV